MRGETIQEGHEDYTMGRFWHRERSVGIRYFANQYRPVTTKSSENPGGQAAPLS
jgi:hypothetical protein